MKFSQRSQKLSSSPLYIFLRKVKAAEAAGKAIISLGLGEPYQDTPEAIKQAGIEAIQQGITRYNPAAGSLSLRQKLAEKYGVAIERVVTSNGAKPFLASVFWSLVDEGDLVYLAAPIYPPFKEIISSCGAEVVSIDTKAQDFKLTLSLLEAAFKPTQTNQSAYLLVNSPNNPTGVTYDQAELKKIVAFCQQREITIIADECYSNFSPDPTFSLRQFADEIIVINSFSKTYAMTGWRLGFAICPPELAASIVRYLDSYVGCASAISDHAATFALSEPPLADFIEQRKIMLDWLAKHNLPVAGSTGGIFVFPDFSKVIEKLRLQDGFELADYFLDQAGVAVTPGSAFGQDYQNHLRLCYSIEPEKLRTALDELSQLIN